MDTENEHGQATKPAATILKEEISSGREQLERPALGLLLSAVSAGLDIGLGSGMTATVTALAWLHFQVFATVGNAIGGVVLVAALKFGHVTQGDRR